jgi:hypothetical protein
MKVGVPIRMIAADADIIYQNSVIGKVYSNDFTEILPFKGETVYEVDMTMKLEMSKVSPIGILQDLRKNQQIELDLSGVLKIQYLGSFFYPKFSYNRNLTQSEIFQLSKDF